MSKFRFYEFLLLSVVTAMICLFLHGCHSPFMGENTFVASPSYIVDGNLYVKKADVKLDSTKHLVWRTTREHRSQKDNEGIHNLYEQGKILTTSEFASNITGYYNTLVSVLVGLFILFSIFGYFTLNEKFKKELEEKEKGLEERLEKVVEKELSDSLILQRTIIKELQSSVEDWVISKDDALGIKNDVDKIKHDIESLYELNDELITDRNIVDN